jgi:hypothetical protein
LGGGPLTINGQVTVGGQGLANPTLSLFNSRKNNNATFANGLVRIANGAGNPINLLQGGTGGTTQTTAPMTPANVNATWGSQIQLGVQALSIPSISTLGVGGTYHEQADVRFVYIPDSTIPFAITATKRNASGIGTPSTLNEDQLRSLRQPVLVTGGTATAGFCTIGTPPTLTPTLDSTQTTDVLNALRRVILSQTTPIPFSAMSSPLSPALSILMQPLLPTSIPAPQQAQILASSPNQIAALGSGCFVSAPIQNTNIADRALGVRFFNNRDNREINLLQINLESLTIWNSGGSYWNSTTNTLTSANQLLFATATGDTAAPGNSFQTLGLAGSDTSSNGLVFHATVSLSAAPTAALPNPLTTTTSPYGFALIKGRQLPGLAETTNRFDPTGLTFVSDQAVYLQGDYNTVNWQPASILADSLNILSNRCLDTTNDRIVKTSGMGCGGNPTVTSVNTAFLAGTTITVPNGAYNGGLENYPRLHENWTGVNLNYLGSFVSTGTPLRVNSNWPGTGGNNYNAPNRNWGYDNRFNNAKNLPPLSPRFVFLKQEGFSRNFDQ